MGSSYVSIIIQLCVRSKSCIDHCSYVSNQSQMSIIILESRIDHCPGGSSDHSIDEVTEMSIRSLAVFRMSDTLLLCQPAQLHFYVRASVIPRLVMPMFWF
jgi:hypothetical protein